MKDSRTISFSFSNRSHGDMRKNENRERFLRQKGFPLSPLVMGEQVHGNLISRVTNKHTDIVAGVDGLLYQDGDMSDDQIVLAVRTADCIPLLLFDPKKLLIAAVHSGWKGTLSHIGIRTIDQFMLSGSNPKDIQVVIGPHIRLCCYSVPDERAVLFSQAFTKDIIGRQGQQYFLDLTTALKQDLYSVGIERKNIFDQQICTSCSVHNYYSYRKDTKETFGEMLGIITISRYNKAHA